MLVPSRDPDGVLRLTLTGDEAAREARVVEAGLRTCQPSGTIEIMLGVQPVRISVQQPTKPPRPGRPVPPPIS